MTNLTRDEAAAQAIQLFFQEVKLCDGTQPSKVPKTSIESNPESLAKSVPQEIMNTSCSTDGTASSSSQKKILQHDVSIQFPTPKSSTLTVQIFPITTPDNHELGDCLELQLDSRSASLVQSLPATTINSSSTKLEQHRDVSVQFPTPKSSDSKIQIFPTSTKDNQEPSDCLQLSFDSGPASLAKNLPKILRPSYPTDATSSLKIKQHDISIQFPTPKSSTSTIQSFPNTTEDCLQLSDIKTNNKKTLKRLRSSQSPKLRKSKRKIYCNCMRNISLSRGSDTDCSIIIDSPSTQCSSKTNTSMTLLKSPSFERLLKAYNTNLTKKRGRKPKQQKKNIKRKTINKPSIKKRVKKGKKINKLKINNDDDFNVVDDSRKDAVAELIVLALYLRYLESKKYS